MTGWLAIAALVAQVAQPVPGAERRDSGVVDLEVQAALVADVLPRRDVAELRPRLGLTLTAAPAAPVTLHIDARLDGLAAERTRRVTSVRGELREMWVELRGGPGDVRAGYGRVVWGRLDEIAPTDVVNPLDAARFLFEGRAEARLPVAFVRGRLTASERVRLEGLLVPMFRRGVFDRLDESTSPFNLVNDSAPQLPMPWGRERREPRTTFANVSGGARVDLTVGRVDVGLSAFRGFDGLGPVTVEVAPDTLPLPTTTIVEHYPRFTMVGADFETVAGPWAWRGEVAAFVERALASSSGMGLVPGKAVDAGVGFDRRLGEVRIFASGIVSREWSDVDLALSRTDLSLVGSVERSFARERFFGRAFAVVNPADKAVFLRSAFAWKPVDRVSVEWSGGTFVGTSDDLTGRFRQRDFLLASIRTWLW